MLRLHRSYFLVVFLLALASVALAGCGAVENANTVPNTGSADAGTAQTPGDMMDGGTASPGGMMGGTASPGDMMEGADPSGDMMGGTPDGTDLDQAFIDMMVPHHQGAVEMARIALERAEHPEIQEMATAIIETQEAEIAELRGWRQQWYGSGDTPAMSEMPMMPGMPGMAGMSETMDMALEVEQLRSAPEPFDLAFIDAMIEHHQDAIDAAQLVLQQANRQEIADLAQGVIDAQQQEIDQLRAWRTSWYPDAEAPTP